MALYPNVTNVTDLGTQANVFRNLYTTTVVTPNFSMDYQGSISPRVNNQGALGAASYRFSYAYVTNLDAITFGNAGISFGATAAIPTAGVAYSIGTSESPLYNVSALTLEAITFKNQGISFGMSSALPTIPNLYSLGSSAFPLKNVSTNTLHAESPRSGYRTGLILIDPGSVNKTVDLRSGAFVKSAILSVVKTDGVSATASETDHYVTMPVPSADYLGAELELLIMFHQDITGTFGIRGLSSLAQAPYVQSLTFARSTSGAAGCALYTFKCINALVSGGRYALNQGGDKYSWICLGITAHHTYS